MLSKLWLILASAAVLSSQTYSSVSVDKITASGARVTWTTSTAVPSHINWGTVSGSLTNSNPTINGGNVTSHQWYVSGAPPATTIYYKVCQNSGSCDGTERSFTTAALPSPYPALPTAPAAVTLPAMPTIDGTSLTVASDCSDFASKIATLKALDGNLNHELIIPAGTVCVPHATIGTGDANQPQFTFPAKTGTNPSGTGVIVIRSAATLPPERARITSSWTTSYIVNTEVGIQETATAPTSGGNCTLGQMYWDYTVATGASWALKECTTASPAAYSLVSKTTFTGTPPGSCTANSWYQKTDASDVAHGIYRCDDLGRLLQVQLGITTPFVFASSAKGYRFVGITFDSLRWQTSNPPAWLTNNSLLYGSYFVALLDIGQASNVAIDRCRFTGGSYPNRYQGLLKLRGTNNYVANSSFEGISMSITPAGGAEPSNQTEYTGVNITGGQYILIDNNYFEGPGIQVMASDDVAAGYAQDVRVTRNRFYIPSTYWYNHSGSNGRFYHNRHGIEMKRGQRWLIDANSFEGAFATVNQAHPIALSMRPSGNGATVVLEDIDITNNTVIDAPNGIYVSGHNDSDSDQGQVVRRVRLRNNLIYGIDGDRYASNYSQRRGGCFESALGGEDLTIEQNTCVYGGTGQYPALYLTDTAGGKWGALTFIGNIGSHVAPSNNTTGISRANNSSRGTATLTAAFERYTATPNVFINLNSQTTTDYPAGNLWPASTAAVGFYSTTAPNYRLKFSSTYAPTGPGANLDAISVAQGVPYNLRAGSITSSGATVYWTAPDASTACTIEYGTSATVGTGSRVTDSPSSRFRSKALTGLSSGTVYYYRVFCGQMASADFTTL